MAVTIRKWATFIEELHEEGGKPLARPLRRVAVAVVVKNPYAGRNPDELTELIGGPAATPGLLLSHPSLVPRRGDRLAGSTRRCVQWP